jgi:fumarate hydratase subunit beta
MEYIRISTPLDGQTARSLRAGDMVKISGTIYTARDAAHKRLIAAVEKGEELPIDVKDGIIYYVGPAPTPPGMACGSAGPTTSYRMDKYTPALLDRGLRGMIGKGVRSAEVIASMQKNGAVYFGATGGAAALISQCITESEPVLYGDLGAEAVYRMKVQDFPVIVIIDSEGRNLYEDGPAQYRRSE